MGRLRLRLDVDPPAPPAGRVDEAEAAFYRSFGAYVAPRKLNDDDEDMVARFGEYVGGRKKGRSAGGGEAKKKRRS